jgi:hypothetical protein
MVEAIDEGFGLECWRQFNKEYDRQGPGHHRTRLMQIIDPKFSRGDQDSYRMRLKKWKKLLKEYQRIADDKIPETILVGVMQTKLMPAKMREHCLLNSTKFNTMAELELEVDNYLIANEGADSEAMEINYTHFDRKGGKRSKGKGKGKGGKGKKDKGGKGKGKKSYANSWNYYHWGGGKSKKGKGKGGKERKGSWDESSGNGGSFGQQRQWDQRRPSWFQRLL